MSHSKTWKTLSSKYVYENPWMQVRHDEVIQPDGKEGIYGVVEGRDFVCVIPKVGDKYYMVEQYRYAVKERSLEFPQGGIEKHERAIDAVHRELEEEAALKSNDITKLGFLYLANGHQTIGFYVYVADHCTPGKHNLDATEQDMITQIRTLDEIRYDIKNGTIKDATTVSAFGLYMLHSK